MPLSLMHAPISATTMRFVAASLSLLATAAIPRNECCRGETNPRCQRPLIVWKLGRTGSSYLAEQLESSNDVCYFVPELTNHLNHSNCAEIAEAADAVLSCNFPGDVSGFSLNPFKFSSLSSCADEIMNVTERRQPAVVVLTRNNVVAQRVSSEISKLSSLRAQESGLDFKDYGVGCGPYHRYRCDDLPVEYAQPILNVRPEEFVESVKDQIEQNDRLLKFVESWFGEEKVFQLAFEDLIRVTSLNMTIASWLNRNVLCNCECDRLPPVEQFESSTPLQAKLENYDEVHAYVAENAPEFLEFFGR